MSAHLITSDKALREVSFDEGSVSIDLANPGDSVANEVWILLQNFDALDFKNKVLWAYEKYLREKKKEEANETRGS